MKYRSLIASALLVLAVGCEKKTPQTAEQPEQEAAAEAAEEAEQAEAAREEEHGRPMEFSLSSEAFAEGGNIPTKYTCDGLGISPPLSWAQAPDGTESFAVVMVDPDAPRGTFHHWGVWGIPPAEHFLAPNVPDEVEVTVATPDVPDPEVTAYQAQNDLGKIGYAPPCPPKGDEPHRYVFRIFALDHPGANFEDVPTVAKLLEKLSEDAIAQASLVGRYQREK